MPLAIIDTGGTNRAITQLRIIDAGGTDRVITEMRIIDTGGTDRVIYTTASALSVSVSDDLVSGLTNSGTAITNSTTATASGGTAPYTYAWTLISYSHPSVAPTVQSPTSATTSFVQTSIGTGEYFDAVFRVTATDAATNTATADVQAVWSDIT